MGKEGSRRGGEQGGRDGEHDEEGRFEEWRPVGRTLPV